MPRQEQKSTHRSNVSQASDLRRDERSYSGRESPVSPPQPKPEKFQTWNVQEVDGRKKYKATLAISSNTIKFTPNKSEHAASQWPVSDLMYYNHEKKHIFLEFQHPTLSLDLQVSNKDTVEEILSVIGTVAGANRGVGLKEVFTTVNKAGQNMAKVLYDFEAQSKDELTVKEGETVFVTDKEQSREWWMVRNGKGKEGVIPSSYIELAVEASKKKSSDGHKTNESVDKRSDKSKPDAKKMRTWTDRSGTFKVEAQFLGCVDGKIHLHKANGVKISVAANKMSVNDVEFVERLTGQSLEDGKPLVDISRNTTRTGAAHSSIKQPSTSNVHSASNSTSHVSSSQPREAPREPAADDYDWFDFFLQCGIDHNSAQRYAINFNRDKMDESVLEQISPSVLRSLGLKEGDILRVTKKLDEKFARMSQAPASQQLPQQQPQQQVPQPPLQPVSQPQQPAQTPSGFTDDAWAVKSQIPASQVPSQQGSSQFLPQQTPQQPPSQPSAPLQDFLDFAPKPTPQTFQTSQTTAPRSLSANPTGSNQLQPNLTNYSTGQGVVTVPINIPIQFQPVAAQPSGPFSTGGSTGQFAPLQGQSTGGAPLVSQLTGGNVFAQPMQSQQTGGNMFGQPVQSQPSGGNIFGQPVQSQQTGGNVFGQLQSQQTGGNVFGHPMQSQQTGGNIFGQPIQSQQTGGNIFGQPLQNQQTGGMIFSQPTQSTGASNFGQQLFQSQPTGGQSTGSSIFGQPLQGQATGNNGLFGNPTPSGNQFGTNVFGTPAFSSQPNLHANNTSSTFMSSQPSLASNPSGQMMQPQSSFGQNLFGTTPVQQQQPQQQTINGMFNQFQQMNLQGTGSYAPQFQQQQQQQPSAFFQQSTQQAGSTPSLSQPLQSQASGFGLGPQPLQPSATGRRANLSSATPQNPFGF